jgi:hypothetical protein
MTVSTTTSRVTYTGDGSTTSFPVPFPFFDETEIEVVERVIATGAETVKAITTDYTVAGGAGTTGTVTAVSAPAASVQWVIRRVTAQTQLVDYTPNDPFPAETHEQALDRAAMRDQELSERIGRALTIPVTDPSSVVTELPSSVDRASKFFAFDANGNPTTAVGTSGDLTPVSSFMNGLLGAADAQSARDTLVAAGKPASSTARKLALWSDASGNLKDGPALGSSGQVLTSQGSSADPAFADLPLSFRNLLVNGGFLIWQRGATVTTPSDNAYGPDRWRCLGEDATGAGSFTVTREASDFPAGAMYAAKCTLANANEKFGLLQVLESVHSVPLRSQNVVLSLKAKGGSVSNIVKMAVLSWNGTADATTGDPISAWNGETTNPTLAANWSFVAVAIVPVTTTWGSRFAMPATAVPADCNNLAVFLWSDDKSIPSGGTDYFADVQLEVASAATAFERRDFPDELARCQRFYQKSFPYGTAPAQNAGNTGALMTCSQTTSATRGIWASAFFKRTMRGAPSIAFYNPSAANALMRNVTDGADVSTAPTAQTTSDSGFMITANSGTTDNQGDVIAVHWSADAEI